MDYFLSGGIPGDNHSLKISGNSLLIQSGVVILLGFISAILATARYNSIISFFLISALSQLHEITEILIGSSGSLTIERSILSIEIIGLSGYIIIFRPLRNGMPKIASHLSKSKTYNAFDVSLGCTLARKHDWSLLVTVFVLAS